MTDNQVSQVVDSESPRGTLIGKPLFSKLDCCAFERECYQRQKRLEILAKELARSNEELNLFASMASHDLQEPLRTIATYLQMIEKNEADLLAPESKEYLQSTIAASMRLRGLISDLLAYSRVDMKKPDFVHFKASAAVEKAVCSLNSTISENQACIEIDDLPEVCADSNRMVQLFENLISNAIKYRSDSLPFIKISAQRKTVGWVFKVADNGVGIQKPFQKKIFEIFRRLHGSKLPGTGIGLAICKKIVEQRGGEIWVESEPAKGSEFYFTIPDELPCV